MSKNVSTAAKYLRKEIARLEKESEAWLLKESIARENKENAQRQIEKLEAQIEELEPKTAFASL